MTPSLDIERRTGKNTVRVFATGTVADMSPAKIRLHWKGCARLTTFSGRWMVQPGHKLGTHYFTCDHWPRFFKRVPIKVEVAEI